MKLTEKILKRLGYRKCGKDVAGGRIWRITPPYYSFDIQVVLGDYPANNPNCGVVSVFDRARKEVGYNRKGKRKKIKFKEMTQPIAWYVDTPERLHQIVVALTHENL